MAVKKSKAVTDVEAALAAYEAASNAIPGVSNLPIESSSRPVDPKTGRLDLTAPENADSARLQAQADAFFKANPDIDPLTGGKKEKTPSGPTVTSKFYTGVGANRMLVEVYSDGTTKQTAAPETVATNKTVVSTYTDPTTGDVFSVFSDGSKAKLATGGQDQAKRQSAYDVLVEQFSQYGLESLVTPLKDLITSSTSPSEFAIRLRETDAYKKRFAGNAARVAKGLAALSEGDYIKLEDKYQAIMRNYGLPASYYSKGDLGRQEGFEKLIANDVSAAELEDRILLAQDRVLKAAPEISAALKKFYPDVTNGDILAYALDPQKALTDIKKKVTTAEIAGTAAKYGLTTSEIDAEYLARYGVTKEKAEQGYATVSDILSRGRQLGDFYGSPYTQEMAEVEAFGLPSYEESKRQRKRLAALETASFAGQSGLTQGALSRERSGQF